MKAVNGQNWILLLIVAIILVGIIAYKDNIIGELSGKYYIKNGFCYSDVLDNCDGKKVIVEGNLSEGKMVSLTIAYAPDFSIFNSEHVLLTLSNLNNQDEAQVYEAAKKNGFVRIVGRAEAGKKPASEFVQYAMCKGGDGQFKPCSTIIVEKIEVLK